MQVTTDSQPPTRLLTRIRPWLAVIVAAIIFTLIPVVGLPLFFALPLIGLALAAGSPPDYVVDAKTVADPTRSRISASRRGSSARRHRATSQLMRPQLVAECRLGFDKLSPHIAR